MHTSYVVSSAEEVEFPFVVDMFIEVVFNAGGSKREEMSLVLGVRKKDLCTPQRKIHFMQ